MHPVLSSLRIAYLTDGRASLALEANRRWVGVYESRVYIEEALHSMFGGISRVYIEEVLQSI